MNEEAKEIYSTLTDIRVGNLLESHDFQVAKSEQYKDYPHGYTVLKRHGWDYNTFKAVCNYIRTQGVTEYFYKTPYVYFYFGEYKYWVMDKNPSDAILINRCQKDKKYQ